jgi:hypothetical protein
LKSAQEPGPSTEVRTDKWVPGQQLGAAIHGDLAREQYLAAALIAYRTEMDYLAQTVPGGEALPATPAPNGVSSDISRREGGFVLPSLFSGVQRVSVKDRNLAHQRAEMARVNMELARPDLSEGTREGLTSYRADLLSRRVTRGLLDPGELAVMRFTRLIENGGAQESLAMAMEYVAQMAGIPSWKEGQVIALKEVVDAFGQVFELARNGADAKNILGAMEANQAKFRRVQLLGTGAGKTLIFVALLKLVQPVNSRLKKPTFMLADTVGNVDNVYQKAKLVWGDHLGKMLVVHERTPHADIARVADGGGVLFMTYGTLAAFRLNDLRAEKTGSEWTSRTMSF